VIYLFPLRRTVENCHPVAGYYLGDLPARESAPLAPHEPQPRPAAHFQHKHRPGSVLFNHLPNGSISINRESLHKEKIIGRRQTFGPPNVLDVFRHKIPIGLIPWCPHFQLQMKDGKNVLILLRLNLNTFS